MVFMLKFWHIRHGWHSNACRMNRQTRESEDDAEINLNSNIWILPPILNCMKPVQNSKSIETMEKYLKQFVRRKTGQDIAENYGKDWCSVKPTEIVSYCAIWIWCERSPTLWLMAKIKLGQNIQTEAHPNPTENWTNNDDNKVKCRLLRWWQG